MSTHSIAHETARQQGWSTATLLDVCLRYIANQRDDSAFAEHMAQAAAQDARDRGAVVGRPVPAGLTHVEFNR